MVSRRARARGWPAGHGRTVVVVLEVGLKRALLEGQLSWSLLMLLLLLLLLLLWLVSLWSWTL